MSLMCLLICNLDLRSTTSDLFEMRVIMSPLDKAQFLKKVSPTIGGVFFCTSGKNDDVAPGEIFNAVHDDRDTYTVQGWNSSFGNYGSPLHGKMLVMFVWRSVLDNPSYIFGDIHTKTCMNASSMMSAVSADLRRGWLEMQKQAEGKTTEFTPAEVSEYLKGMQKDGLLPQRFVPAGLAGIDGAQSSLAVARMEALQWWMTEQGKDFGVIDVTGKDGTAYLDGSYPKISGWGKKAAVVAWRERSQPSQVRFQAVTNIDVLAILGYDLSAYNIAVSTHQSITQMLSHCVPVPVAYAAVMAAASVMPTASSASSARR